jgi:single-strand DNA-binding protein
MKSLNKVQLIGNLGEDPELKYTGSGAAVSSFSVATSEKFKKNDVWKESKEWHRIVAWGRSAEIASEYLHKGSKVYIEGRLQTRAWDDKDGNKRYTTEIVARDIIMLDGKE